MKYCKIDNRSPGLILFFTGWGCDKNQFVNLCDTDDVLIFWDYQDLELDFDFSAYERINLVAYSAGVFAAAALSRRLPLLQKKTAVNGNPYLFNEKLGLSSAMVETFRGITAENYLSFRREYMVEDEDEFILYNRQESCRTIESCTRELECLQQLYEREKDNINPDFFDAALISDHDRIFDLESQRQFYGSKMKILPNAKHHVFFRFSSLAEILNY